MVKSLETAPTEFIQNAGITFAYRRLGNGMRSAKRHARTRRPRDEAARSNRMYNVTYVSRAFRR